MSRDPLRSGLGAVHHPVSTKNAEAQKYFDQGLALYYGFNHNAAARSFRVAAELDPSLAMAHWGVALALGPNINAPVTPEREAESYTESRKAQALEGQCTPAEKALIEAVATRYSNDPKADMNALSAAYRVAMKSVADAFPKDADAQTLYAESIMDVHPWQLWSLDGKPTEGTEDCIRALRKVLATDENHIGANHFLIHALEASPHPEEALEASKRLAKLAPNSGHLVHMPSHIYIRTGDYHEGVVANEKALVVDEAFLKRAKDTGVYPMYYLHNFDMLRCAANMEGNFSKSQPAAEQIVEKMPHMEGMPPMEGVMSVADLNLVRFHKWSEVLANPVPSADHLSVAMVHFARGMADANTGKPDDADAEFQTMEAEKAKLTPDSMWGFNPSAQVLGISEHVLHAAVAKAKHDSDGEIKELEAGVQMQDQLSYDEPPDYFFPVRESLGGALLRGGKANDAEAVFRADLERNARNGRSLFGLWQALKMQHKPGAEAARKEFEKAWRWADVQLSVEGL